jgi:hypothetical protein
MRVLSYSEGDDSHGHGHGHHHHHHGPSEAISTSVNVSGNTEGLKQRIKEKVEGDAAVKPAIQKSEGKEVSASLRLSAYLNLFGDFSKYSQSLSPTFQSMLILCLLAHNITDGLVGQNVPSLTS